MRIWLAPVAIVALASACKADESHFPVIIGGGPGVGGGGGPDAGTAAGDARDGAVSVIDGLVCLMSDPRDQTTCAATGVGGLSVTLDGVTVVTADSGAFVMPAPAGTNLLWQVTGTTVIPSLMGFSASAVIPAINADQYHTLQLSNGIIDVSGEGGLFARVLEVGVPLAGVTAATTPPPDGQPLYDGTNATTWNQHSTGAHGMVWIAGLTAGAPTTLTVTPNGGTAQSVSNLTIGDESLTFVTIDVP